MNQNSVEPEVKKIIPSHRKDADSTVRIKGMAEEEEGNEVTEILKRFFKRQANSVLPKIGAGAEWWDAERWDSELADDLAPVMMTIADRHGEDTAKQIGMDYVKELTAAYLRKMAEGRATAINTSTQEKLEEAIADDEMDPAEVFEKRESNDAVSYGLSLATAVASWSTLEAVHQAQDNGFTKKTEKEWVTGYNPRPTHAAMNGERVPINERFSNGADWPGDDSLEPAEKCRCNCSTAVIITWED